MHSPVTFHIHARTELVDHIYRRSNNDKFSPIVYRTARISRPAKCVAEPQCLCFRAATTKADEMKYSYSSPTATVLQDGKIKPGIYKIQNIVSKTYVDIKDDLRELCGRPSSALERSRGHVSLYIWAPGIPNNQQWEILPLGPGYTIRKVRITRGLSYPWFPLR